MITKHLLEFHNVMLLQFLILTMSTSILLPIDSQEEWE